MKNVYLEASTLAERDEKFVLATVVNTSGSTPQRPGACLLVRSDGSTVGTLGGGCVEGAATDGAGLGAGSRRLWR